MKTLLYENKNKIYLSFSVISQTTKSSTKKYRENETNRKPEGQRRSGRRSESIPAKAFVTYNRRALLNFCAMIVPKRLLPSRTTDS